MDLKKFHYKKFFTKEYKYSKKIKHLIRLLQDRQYSLESHKRLLSYDLFAYPQFNIKGANNFFKDAGEIVLISQIKTKFIFSNIIEKFIIYSNKNNNIKKISLKDEREFHNIILNSGSFEDKNNFLSRLMFSISNEQMIFQDRNLEQYFYRTLTIFKNCEISRILIKKQIGLELEEILLFYRLIFIYITNSQNIICDFSIRNFEKFVLSYNLKDISQEKITNFLNFILIDINEFKKQYFQFRSLENKLISYDKLNEIDKYLPKISFYYPLIKVQDDIFRLTSYTALNQFMHLERLFNFISEEKENNYKSKVFGSLLENYITTLAIEFKEYHHLNINIYSQINQNMSYVVGKNRYDLPDVIIETDDCIIFIESKTSAFNIKNALINFNENDFSNIVEAIDKSKKNIDRFLLYNPLNIKNLQTKKIYKLICFNIVNSAMLASLKHSDFMDFEDIVLTDLQSLELLFNIQNKNNLNEILSDYLKYYNDILKGNSIYYFCIENFEINYNRFNKAQSDTINLFTD